MALPVLINPASPLDTDSPGLGAQDFRTLEQQLLDILGLTGNTAYTGALVSAGTNTDGSVAADTIVKGTTPFKRLAGTEASGKDIRLIEDTGVFKIQRNDASFAAPVWTTLWQLNLTTGESGGTEYTNNTGVTLAVGDVVTTDATLDSAVTLDDTQGSLRQFLVSLDTPLNGAVGRFLKFGSRTTVNVLTAVRGNFLRKSSTTRVLEDTGVAAASFVMPPMGTVGLAETNAAAGQCIAMLFDPTEAVGPDIAPPVMLANKTGGPMAPNDAAALGVANDAAVELSDVQGSLKTFVVALDSIANNATGRYVRAGKVTVKVQGAVIRGNFLRKSATTLAFEDSGLAMTSTTPPAAGAVGVALTGAAGPGLGTVTAFQYGTTLPGLGAAVGSYEVRGLAGVNNAGTPNTKYDLTSADLIQFRNPSTGATNVITTQGLLTCDLTVQGRNGRDQAGALATSAFVHFYYTWDGATVATRGSQVAPPTGPTLANGEIGWAYAGPVWNAAGPALRATRMRGAAMILDAEQSALAGGSATVETSVSVSSLVPPNALSYSLHAFYTFTYNAAGDGAFAYQLRTATGVTFLARPITALGQGSAHNYGSSDGEYWLPNIGQTFFYLWTGVPTGGSAQALTLNVASYRVPNGGE